MNLPGGKSFSISGSFYREASFKVIVTSFNSRAADLTACFGGAAIKVIDNLVSRLKSDIESWRVEKATILLQSQSATLSSLKATEKNAPILVGYLAQWVDIGYGDIALVKKLLTKFSQSARGELQLNQYVHLCMADALIAMRHHKYDHAIRHLETVLSLHHEIRDLELEVMSNFWLGKCHMREGRIETAIICTVKAKELAWEMGWHGMSTVIQVLQGDLTSQIGKPSEALRILQAAERFTQTDDYIARGNISSTYARIARREGKFEESLQLYEKAVCEYKKRKFKHPHATRTLLEMGFVKRAIALKLEDQADKEAARRRGSSVEAANDIGRKQRLRIELLRNEARTHLTEAALRYKSENDNRGIGIVLINRSRLDLDSGQLDRAAIDAAEAFQRGHEKSDQVLKVRARVLESMIENAKFAEQIEDGSDIGRHAQLAYQFASEAVNLAKETRNIGLLARALIAKGMVLANDYFSDRDAARACADEATRLLRRRGENYMYEDLEIIKARIRQMSGIDRVLREFSPTNVENRTFQQISEEFASIVIPKIWKSEGRKISRVVERLSISPKKVRRILCSVGLLDVDGNQGSAVPTGAEHRVKVGFGNTAERPNGRRRISEHVPPLAATRYQTR
jgi:tetratricopeptide (TPR) repeat protein